MRAVAVAKAWLAHAYTASGIVLALLAARAAIDYQFRDAFFWLTLQVIVDATDGVLARAARVREVIPWFDGVKLDDVIDYVAYVFVPALIVWRALLVPGAWAMPVAAAMLLSSAYGFNRADAKTADHLFTGFPSYWNIIVLYLFIAQLPAAVNAGILLLLAVLVFVPVRYVYPTRTTILRGLTLALGAVWGALMLLMLWQWPAVSRPILYASLIFPGYYTLLSLALNARAGRVGGKIG